MADTQDIISILDKIIARYSAEGGFGKAEEALLKREKTKAMASGQQRLVSAGLAGTTVGAGMEQRWEEERGIPERLRLEDIRTQRLTEAMAAKAGYMEREGARAEATSLAQQQMAQQKEQTEMGALAQVHAAKYGTTGGGGKKTWEDYFGGGEPAPAAPATGAPGGATQHIGQGGVGSVGTTEEAWFKPTGLGAGGGAQAGLKAVPGSPGALPWSAFQAMNERGVPYEEIKKALAQGYDYFGPGGQQALSQSTIAGQKDKSVSGSAQMTDEFRSMAQTAQKWLAGG